MNCPNCDQPVEADAAYCGNCGQRLLPTTLTPATSLAAYVTDPAPSSSKLVSTLGSLSPDSALAASLPSYALARIHIHNHLKPLLALLLGIIGIAGAFFIPLLGITLGIAGLVLASLSVPQIAKGLRIASMVCSIAALLAGLAVWVFVATHNPSLYKKTTQVSPNGVASQAATSLNTPCYSLGFRASLNIENQSGSCEMNAYDGASLQTSNSVYKVLTTTVASLNSYNLAATAKSAIEQDVSKNLQGFSVTHEQATYFAGSPAYIVSAYNKSANVAAVEAAVLHNTASGSNLFVLVHAVAASNSTDLSGLESNWQWK